MYSCWKTEEKEIIIIIPPRVFRWWWPRWKWPGREWRKCRRRRGWRWLRCWDTASLTPLLLCFFFVFSDQPISKQWHSLTYPTIPHFTPASLHFTIMRWLIYPHFRNKPLCFYCSCSGYFLSSRLIYGFIKKKKNPHYIYQTIVVISKFYTCLK